MSKATVVNNSTSIDKEQANSAICAMQIFQKQMSKEANKAELSSEDDVDKWITESRRKENSK